MASCNSALKFNLVTVCLFGLALNYALCQSHRKGWESQPALPLADSSPEERLSARGQRPQDDGMMDDNGFGTNNRRGSNRGGRGNAIDNSLALGGRSCVYDNECPGGYTCTRNLCFPDSANKHLEGRKCAHDGNCPQGYRCNKMTCFEGESKKHLEARSCHFDYECPSGWTCYENGICYEDAENNHIEGRICGAHYQCPSTYYCDQEYFTCYYDGTNHLEQFCSYDSSPQAPKCPGGYFCDQNTCRLNDSSHTGK